MPGPGVPRRAIPGAAMSERGGATGGEGDALREVEIAFARCFARREGTVALAYLRRTTLERALGPDASEAALRHLEGQRQLVARIAALIERGRA